MGNNAYLEHIYFPKVTLLFLAQIAIHSQNFIVIRQQLLLGASMTDADNVLTETTI